MNLNSNQEVFNMFFEFKNIYKHQIYNRYKRMNFKNLEELIEYLQNNDIKEEDLNIQVKKYINVKEFEEIYDISKSSQRDYIGRLHNPFPYHQKVFRGKILYDVEEIEKWLENEYK
ncbi:hypothetical protein CRU99_00955 [Malaciobacter mytili]|uniref:hypothetical protein n=1 Tax=Malaciobacter mytili TaxID=603050 RepID=UPI00100ACFDD|nr:hypothetical protein [Malaciobacter mytili]RXI48393.1 hypothetical protein CRU99_00955 [Malaciobacter mytili]